MIVCAEESTVPSLIKSAKAYCIGRDYSASGEARAWQNLISKLLMIRSAKYSMVVEDYERLLCTVK